MAYEPIVWRSVTASPGGTGTNTLSVWDAFSMIGGKPVKVNVLPSTLSTMLANDEPALLGVSTKCQ
jgi:hypothetical protein